MTRRFYDRLGALNSLAPAACAEPSQQHASPRVNQAVEDALTAHSTDSDISTLNALSRLLAEQIARLDEALDLVTDTEVHDIIIRAQLTREDALDRIRARIRHLGQSPPPLPDVPPPAIGPEDIDNEETLDELAEGENELCVQFRKGVDDQELMPHTRHFLRNILDRISPSVPRPGMMWIH